MSRMAVAGHLGVPADFPGLCSYLCSDDAGYITGQVIGVNDGAVI